MKRIIAVLSALFIIAGLTGCSVIDGITDILPSGISGSNADFTVNELSLPEERENAPDALAVYGGEDIGFSFLYPEGMHVTFSEEDGACISDGTEGEIPYVLISKTAKKGMTPEKYFKSSDQQMLKEFDDVQSTTIHEVPLEEKTLYMTRYQCGTGSADLVIDRYVEIYDDCYIQYTAVSQTAEEMNTAMYYAATTLSPEPGYYVGEYSDEFAAYAQGDTGISMKLPTMLDIRELTVGYFASCDDAILLAVLCTEDDSGNPIYNRQNFLDCASANPDFVAGYIGTESASFGTGTKQTINGNEFYAYPMTTKTGEEQFTGEIFLANSDESGCIVVCYAVKDNSARYDKLSELCQEAVNSVEY